MGNIYKLNGKTKNKLVNFEVKGNVFGVKERAAILELVDFFLLRNLIKKE